MKPRMFGPQTPLLEISLYQTVTNGFKQLIEHKHLYQSLRLETDEVFDKLGKTQGPGPTKTIYDRFRGEWRPIDESDKSYLFTEYDSFYQFSPPDVKLYCSTCSGVQPFNFFSSRIVLHNKRIVNSGTGLDRDALQVFAFTFLCQSCKSDPEAFLVRREGNKLTLSGRSPIEHVEIPKVIPKPIHKYFSDAIVAHQSGQTLAGNFMLRTLIEQWAYSQAEDSVTSADQAIKAYMDSLPEDFKNHFPSLADLYSRLSLDIHKATGSVELFESSIPDITVHFDARRLHKIPDKSDKTTKP